MEKLSDDNYKDVVNSGGYVILDFSSPGCAPCKKIPPLIEEIIAELSDKNIKAFEIDVVENTAAARDYFVLGVPTVIIIKDGKELKRFNSVPKKAKLINSIN